MKFTASQLLAANFLRAPHAKGRFPGKVTWARGLFFWLFVLYVVGMLAPAMFAQSGVPPMTVGAPTVDANGVKYYSVSSAYQGSHQQIIRVLQPTNPPPGTPPRLLFVLPVDAGVDTLSSPYSDGLEQLRLLDAQDQFNFTLIAPSFDYEPWYSDNILDAKQMESFVINHLVPFGDTFISSSVPQRYLIGFSKSGNGALDLILRHPGVFNGAAIWDSPVQTSDISVFPGLLMNFGSQANFNSYNIPALVASNASAFRQQTRLWISGDQADYQAQMIQLHKQLTAAGIPHTWVEGGARAHSWRSGWLQGAVSGLAAIATQTLPYPGALPPPRSAGQPAGVLPATTTQATLSLITDRNATCRYGTSAGTAYGLMTNTFSTTGDTAHSTPLTGLDSGMTYSYYVRCQDAAGNTNTDDYVITFAVSGTSAAVSSTFSGVELALSDGMWDTPGSFEPMSENNAAYATGIDAARVVDPLLGPDQYAEITYDRDPGSATWVGVMTRMQGTTNGSGYLAFVNSGAVWLYRADDNGSLSWNELATASVDVSVAPRDLRLETQGNTHRVIFNGVLQISYTDPNNVYTSGQPAIAGDPSGPNILTFSGGTLIPGPVVSGGQPSGVLVATTTQVKLSVNTNENATCRYGTTAGVPYGSMPNTFGTTGGTAHSTVMTGLVSNTRYGYYVRCQDAAGNADTYDYLVAFTVSSTATTASSAFSGVAPVLSDNGLWATAGSWGAMSENNGAYSLGADAAIVANPLLGPDEYSEITYDHDPGTSGWPGVMTRMAGPTKGSGYLAIAFGGTVRLYRVDDNGGLSFTQLATANLDISVPPRDLRLESQGNTHRVIFNGVLQFSYTDPNNVYASGQPGIAAATYSTILTFAGGTLIPGPVVSGGQPSGVLVATTTQVTLSVSTNENATCRYGTTAGVPYGSMPNTFSATGGTTHSTQLTGLTSGSNYNYYIRCQDSAGHADTYDYVVSFAVSSTATTASSTFPGVASVLSDNELWSTAGSWGAMSENNGAYSLGADAAMVANPLLSPNQYSEITYDHDPGTSGWPGVMTRMAGPTKGSGYLAIAFGGTVRLYRVDDNGSLSFTQLATANVDISVAPRDLRLESQGNTHRVIFNGALQITYTDPNNVYASGQPGIAAATYSTILTFTGGELISGPVVSGGQPTGVLPAGTTQATLRANTNENATCRYATTAGVSYGSMPNTFSTTGGMAHSTQLTGLTNGGNYNYYIRCQDAAGNADTYDYAVSFGVSSSGTTASSTFPGVASVLSDNGLWQTPGSWGAMSENLGAYATGTDAAMVTNPLLGPDEYAEITYNHDPATSGWVGVMTRIQGSTNGSGYLAFAYNGALWLYRVDDNGQLNWNVLASASVDVSVAPRDLRLQSQGNTHKVIFNGVTLITYTDPKNVYSTGQPGIAAAAFSTILTFTGGDL